MEKLATTFDKIPINTDFKPVYTSKARLEMTKIDDNYAKVKRIVNADDLRLTDYYAVGEIVRLGFDGFVAKGEFITLANECFQVIAEFAEEDPQNALVLAAIKIFGNKDPIILKDVCEACGNPTVDFAIHDKCKEWWC